MKFTLILAGLFLYCWSTSAQQLNTCRPVTCMIVCPNGFDVDAEINCPVCRCKKPELLARCPPVACTMPCPHVIEVDPGTNCPVCRCRSPQISTATTPPTICLPVNCALFCSNGFVIDPETNCEVCRCKSTHHSTCLAPILEYNCDLLGATKPTCPETHYCNYFSLGGEMRVPRCCLKPTTSFSTVAPSSTSEMITTSVTNPTQKSTTTRPPTSASLSEELQALGFNTMASTP
ncbi:unnamed protein product [Didymodactylos carnosus]|uniref:Antistasin-like domain-containing protein n=1 Tax=Didymodactylos carnosus TaxID=1234261 RepID=A0A815Z424_9BILA|nr:unnamed protein product [Didymodactylos carnosus]CAF1577738.1 unnamed protein product [Didymodactylos carnosus]CAF3854915.1 unnamed protein product [Didymodactylos carnosus]CAF4443767.1 unnamed protein product [Didymodactylos carnosus]